MVKRELQRFGEIQLQLQVEVQDVVQATTLYPKSRDAKSLSTSHELASCKRRFKCGSSLRGFFGALQQLSGRASTRT